VLRSPDTDAHAHAVQLAIYRRMSPVERSALAIDLSEAVRDTARAGIRARHSTYTALEVDRALFRLLYGDDLARRVWSHEPLVSP
jgi:hypothetical protein